MNRLILLTCTWMMCITLCAQHKNPQYVAYIQQYRDMAIEQQIKHQVPAAITMAQGLLESAAGQSELATQANNHFGIKCANDWVGKTYTHDDEKSNECFRQYASVEDSYEDHSLFLLRKRYESLFALPKADYKAWAHGLSACGYATDPKYPEKLIRIIEQYDLQALTLDTILVKAGIVSESDTTWHTIPLQDNILQQQESRSINEVIHVSTKHEKGRTNGIRYVIASEGDTYQSLAIALNMYERTLRKYNDALDTRELVAGQKVYIYAKKKKASRKHPYHNFRTGEDAWGIAQKYGITLKSLYKMNGIPYGTTLKTNQRLRLR